MVFIFPFKSVLPLASCPPSAAQTPLSVPGGVQLQVGQLWWALKGRVENLRALGCLQSLSPLPRRPHSLQRSLRGQPLRRPESGARAAGASMSPGEDSSEQTPRSPVLDPRALRPKV